MSCSPPWVRPATAIDEFLNKKGLQQTTTAMPEDRHMDQEQFEVEEEYESSFIDDGSETPELGHPHDSDTEALDEREPPRGES